MLAGVAALVFLIVITATVGAWWVWESSQRVRRRLGQAGYEPEETRVLKAQAAASPLDVVARRSSLVTQLTTLAQQAGSRQAAGDLLLLLAAVAGVGAAVGGWHTGSAAGALLGGIVSGFVPV